MTSADGFTMNLQHAPPGVPRDLILPEGAEPNGHVGAPGGVVRDRG